jgi:glycosyltransferase involved in cell wall biosynthesis
MIAMGSIDERPLRICFVSADYLSDWSSKSVGVGGIGTHTFTLARAVAELGHEVTVLTERGEPPWEYQDGDVKVHALPPTSSRMWKLGRWVPLHWIRRSFAANRALRTLHRRYGFDMIRFADGNGEGLRFSYDPFIPFDVHLMGPATVLRRWDGQTSNSMRVRFEKFVERRPAARATVLTCATKRFADLMATEWSLERSRIQIIRNPLNLNAFQPASQPRSADRRVVLFASLLQRRKGVHTLVAAMPEIIRRNPDVEFWFVGKGTRTADGVFMRDVIQRDLGESGVLEHARFLESMHPRELTGLYQRASVVAVPALNDVFPNVALEAMACGTPCVVSTHTGVDELIIDGESGYIVPPDDPPALTAALLRALALSDDARAAMGRQARLAIERECAAPVIAAQTIQSYRKVLADGRVAAGSVARS